jgi:hypothetical protein
VLVTGFFGLVSYGQFARDARAGAFGDALRYIEMSERTFAPVENPFALRLLTPWLVRRASALTDVAPDTVWLAFTFAATTGALIVVYEWLRGAVSISAGTSLFATVLLAVTFNYTSYNYGNFWLVDPLNNLVFALGLLLVFHRRLLLFVLVVLIGFVNKETALFLLPLYPMLAWARSGRLRDRAAWLGVAAGAVVVACYLAFHSWAQAKVGPTATWGGESIIDIARAVLPRRQGREHLAVFGIFGFLWLVFGYGLYRQHRAAGFRSPLLLASGYLFLCCMVGRTQAADTERVYVLLAPLVVAVAATVFDTWRSEGRRMWMWVLGGLYAALSFGWVTGETAVVVTIVGAAGFVVLLYLPDHLLEVPAAAPAAGPEGPDSSPGRSSGQPDPLGHSGPLLPARDRAPARDAEGPTTERIGPPVPDPVTVRS